MLIIFDCDGTLVDSERLSTGVMAQLAREHGVQITAEEALATFVGGSLDGCIRMLEARGGLTLPASFGADYRARMADAFERDLQAMPGAIPMLEQLAEHDIASCIASNGPREKMALSLRLTELKAFFPDERVFSAYDIDVWKPEPDLFLYAAQQSGVAVDKCIVVEDSAAGVDAARRAGMYVVAFGDRVADRTDADIRIDELHAMPAVLADFDRRRA